MGDGPVARAAADAAEAWLDLLLMTVTIALAPYEWAGHFVIASLRTGGISR